ncbi:unnamed protein product [Schistocephalus solidus]|uniref:Uncharacterized protein n=1 Tax=Schistocephalus solidus TaxID=70667 RepID=A0A183SFS4_SCHSO|nr:unnamed protein product [Schistocephalus solidus]
MELVFQTGLRRPYQCTEAACCSTSAWVTTPEFVTTTRFDGGIAAKQPSPSRCHHFPLDILLDNFAIPTDQPVSEPNAAPPPDVPPSVSVAGFAPSERKLLPSCRTNRVGRTTRPIQINPRQKWY